MTWRERIVAARERGAFAQEDRDAANQWNTCAVGEQQAMHPHVVLWAGPTWAGKIAYAWGPIDEDLLRCGDATCGFAFNVSVNDFDAAERNLDAIEDRVLQLKRERGASS